MKYSRDGGSLEGFRRGRTKSENITLSSRTVTSVRGPRRRTPASALAAYAARVAERTTAVEVWLGQQTAACPHGKLQQTLAWIAENAPEQFELADAARESARAAVLLDAVLSLLAAAGASVEHDLQRVASADPLLGAMLGVLESARGEFGELDSPPRDVELEPTDQVSRLVMSFIAACDGQQRRRRGVYFTPRVLADFIMRGVSRSVCDAAGRKTGLTELVAAEPQPASEDAARSAATARLLDPAVGCGVFLASAIGQFGDDWRAAHEAVTTADPDIAAEKWQRDLAAFLPRLAGFDLLLAPLIAAHALVAAELKLAAYDFASSNWIDLRWANPLTE